jgi:Domain of unknown function (DUF1330)
VAQNAAKAYEKGVLQRVVVIEFDSVEKAVAAHDSPGYQAALKVLGNAAIGPGDSRAGRSQGRRCNPAVYTAHDAGQIVDQTAPFARLIAHSLYPEQWSRRMYV